MFCFEIELLPLSHYLKLGSHSSSLAHLSSSSSNLPRELPLVPKNSHDKNFLVNEGN
jgi:hypothetical protein